MFTYYISSDRLTALTRRNWWQKHHEVSLYTYTQQKQVREESEATSRHIHREEAGPRNAAEAAQGGKIQ